MQLVSVIIPCFKNKNTLDRAIKSVLNQTHQLIEIIIVNDFPDQMEEIKLIVSKHPNTKFFYNTKNLGPSKTRNYGVSKSMAEVITFLDADDEYHPRKIELQLRELNPKTAITCGLKKINLDGSTSYKQSKRKELLSPKALIYRNKLNGAGLMCFKKLFIDAGGYNETIKAHEDWELWFRLLSRVKIIDIGKPLYIYYQNANGITSNTDLIAFWEILLLPHFFNQIKESSRNSFLKEKIFFFRFLILIFRNEAAKCQNKNLLTQLSLSNHLHPISKKLLFFIAKLNIFKFINFLIFRINIFTKSRKKPNPQNYFLENQVTKFPLLLKYKKPKVIAITGATGFIGSELVKNCIACGWRIKVLTRGYKTMQKNPQVELFIGDLISTHNWSGFIKNVDVIINCAGTIDNKKQLNAVNVEGPTRLLNAAIGNVKRWVQLSSAGVYGNQKNKTITEKNSLLPKTPYEKSMARFDKILYKASIENKIKIVILRPTSVFGSNMKNQSLFQLVTAIKRKLFFFIGAPNNIINSVHVHDVVNALMLCSVASKKSFKIYNISNDVTVTKLVKIICRALDKKTPKIRLPLFIVKPLVIVIGWLPLSSLNLSRLNALTSKTKYPSYLIKKDLDFKFVMSVKDGLINFVKHLL